MYIFAVALWAACLGLYLAALARELVVGRSGRGLGWPDNPLAALWCLLWCLAAGLAYIEQCVVGQRKDFGFLIDALSRLLPLVASGAGLSLLALARLIRRAVYAESANDGPATRGRSGPLNRPRDMALAAALAILCLIGCRYLVPSDFTRRSEAILLAWDSFSYLILTTALCLGLHGACARFRARARFRACARFRQGDSSQNAASPDPRQAPYFTAGLVAATLSLAALAFDLGPGLGLIRARGFPCLSVPLGMAGLFRLVASSPPHNPAKAPPWGAARAIPQSPSPKGGLGPGLSLLSARELEVARLTSLGLTNHEIAERLFISLATAKKHVANAMAKTATRNRAGLAAMVQREYLGK